MSFFTEDTSEVDTELGKKKESEESKAVEKENSAAEELLSTGSEETEASREIKNDTVEEQPEKEKTTYKLDLFEGESEKSEETSQKPKASEYQPEIRLREEEFDGMDDVKKRIIVIGGGITIFIIFVCFLFSTIGSEEEKEVQQDTKLVFVDRTFPTPRDVQIPDSEMGIDDLKSLMKNAEKKVELEEAGQNREKELADERIRAGERERVKAQYQGTQSKSEQEIAAMKEEIERLRASRLGKRKAMPITKRSTKRRRRSGRKAVAMNTAPKQEEDWSGLYGVGGEVDEDTQTGEESVKGKEIARTGLVADVQLVIGVSTGSREKVPVVLTKDLVQNGKVLPAKGTQLNGRISNHSGGRININKNK